MTATTNREIVVSRVFDAPREIVFNAFTGQGIETWWGPNGFTTTTSKRDVRPGGTWRFVMHGPDGTDYDNRIVYDEIAAPERLMYTHYAGDEPEPHFYSTITFAEQDGKTELTMRLLFLTAELRDQAVGFGAVEGGHQTLGRLAEYLARR